MGFADGLVVRRADTAAGLVVVGQTPAVGLGVGLENGVLG